MALAAIHFLVLALQCVAGQPVVKIVFVKADEFKFPAVVFIVAFETVFFYYRLLGMIAQFLIDEGLDLLMALQAFPVRNLGAQVVAEGTITHSFQVGMGLREITRRNLGEGRSPAQ